MEIDQKEAKISALIIVSCKNLEIDKQSSFPWIGPETWFWWNKKNLDLGFLTLHISHKSIVSFIWISFAKDLFFKKEFLSWVSIGVSNKKLKSPPSIKFLYLYYLEQYLASHAV